MENLVQPPVLKQFVFSPKIHLDGFNNASVPPSAQATFQYIFAVRKFLKSGTYDLVGTIVYEIDQNPYQNTFFNGIIEVAEAGCLLSVESLFLFALGIGLLSLLGIRIRGQIENISSWKLERRQLMPQWMSGWRERHTLNPTN